jgi:hypothetical protein
MVLPFSHSVFVGFSGAFTLLVLIHKLLSVLLARLFKLVAFVSVLGNKGFSIFIFNGVSNNSSVDLTFAGDTGLVDTDSDNHFCFNSQAFKKFCKSTSLLIFCIACISATFSAIVALPFILFISFIIFFLNQAL